MLASSHPIIGKLWVLRDYRFEHRVAMAHNFVLLYCLLFVCQIILLFRAKSHNFKNKWLWFILGLVTLVGVLSYPFLSRDFFTYLFGTKILWHYHLNPYLVSPETFIASDLWVGFTHWIEFTYAYGPFYLLYSLIPAIVFGSQRFILNFYGLKLLHGLVFFSAGWLIWKTTEDRRVISFWFLNPLLILELLINTHNDLIMIGFWILAVFLFKQKKRATAFLAFLLSVLTKYVSLVFLPLFFINNRSKQTLFFKLMVFAASIFFIFKGVHLWYFTWIYLALPFANLSNFSLALIFVFQSFRALGSYYGFVLADNWTRGCWLNNFFWLSYFFPLLLVLFESLPYFAKQGKTFNRIKVYFLTLGK